MSEETDREPPDVDVFHGASDGGFLLWRARQVIEQAERRLESQFKIWEAYERRATTFLGWLSAEIVAVVGGLLTLLSSGPVSKHSIPLIAAAVGLVSASAISSWQFAKVFREKQMTTPGLDPDALAKVADTSSELFTLEWMATPYIEGAAHNLTELDRSYQAIRSGARWFFAAPFAALLGGILGYAALGMAR